MTWSLVACPLSSLVISISLGQSKRFTFARTSWLGLPTLLPFNELLEQQGHHLHFLKSLDLLPLPPSSLTGRGHLNSFLDIWAIASSSLEEVAPPTFPPYFLFLASRVRLFFFLGIVSELTTDCINSLLSPRFYRIIFAPKFDQTLNGRIAH